MVKRIPNRRDRRPHENGGPKTKRARRSTSDQEEDSNSEDEEHEEEMMNGKSQKTNGVLEAAHVVKQEEDLSDAEQNNPDAEKRTGLTNGVKVEKDNEQNEETCHVNGDVKLEEVESEQSVVKPFAESPKPYTEMQSQALVQTEQDSVATTTTEPTSDEQKPCVQSESTQPAADIPPPQPVKRRYS